MRSVFFLLAAVCVLGPVAAQDSTPPAITSATVEGQPSGAALPSGLRSATLAVGTSEPATCRYHDANVGWASMTGTFGTTGGTAHSAAVPVVEGTSYTRWVRCRDAAGNESAATAVSWSIGERGDDCVTESAAIRDREDVVFCEGFESPDWWQTPGWYKDNTRYQTRATVTAEHVAASSVVSSGCVAGNCLRVDVGVGSCCGIAVVWEIDTANVRADEAYLRYYMKLGPNFSPELCDGQGNPIGGSGGKMPGFSDSTTSNDADELCPGGTCNDPAGGTCVGGSRNGLWCGQCGNGGIPGDEYTCWSARANFRNCYNACEANPTASTRYGTYLYNEGSPLGTGRALQWDADDYTSESPCPGGYACGLTDDEGLINNRWYLIEQYIKMNTPGASDGIIRGWTDGVLRYEKTNVYFRAVGHDNLHVRNFWFILFFGGSLVGPCQPTEVMFDQVAIATGANIGPVGPQQVPAAPTNVRVE